MLFKRPFLDGIVSGEITAAFRRWTRPTVRVGGTLKTAVGVLAIDSVERVPPEAITEAEARRAGYPSRDALMAELDAREQGEIYCIELRYAGPDPRIALRERAELSGEELAALRKKLDRLDGASPVGPWTLAVLRLIGRNPGVRAGDLASQFGQERAAFKVNVRKLKGLGLTESLEIGYRLSPRGRALLDSVEKEA
ncbi:MAG: hypothetical protein QOH06_4906 [Acidobacteriota bacterium]|jgi:hypothetical protein|nr:hypothetical protein [Acidobacteriota bacterium]